MGAAGEAECVMLLLRRLDRGERCQEEVEGVEGWAELGVAGV